MKLIIDIPEDMFEWFKNGEIIDEYDKSALKQVFKNGTPLDNNSERAEVQAYFDGEAYGWEQGRKALIDDVKTKIEKLKEKAEIDYGHTLGFDKIYVYKICLDILDNISKAESEDR